MADRLMADTPVFHAIRARLLGFVVNHPRTTLAVAAGLGAAAVWLIVSVL